MAVNPASLNSQTAPSHPSAVQPWLWSCAQRPLIPYKPSGTAPEACAMLPLHGPSSVVVLSLHPSLSSLVPTFFLFQLLTVTVTCVGGMISTRARRWSVGRSKLQKCLLYYHQRTIDNMGPCFASALRWKFLIGWNLLLIKFRSLHSTCCSDA